MPGLTYVAAKSSTLRAIWANSEIICPGKPTVRNTPCRPCAFFPARQPSKCAPLGHRAASRRPGYLRMVMQAIVDNQLTGKTIPRSFHTIFCVVRQRYVIRHFPPWGQRVLRTQFARVGKMWEWVVNIICSSLSVL